MVFINNGVEFVSIGEVEAISRRVAKKAAITKTL